MYKWITNTLYIDIRVNYFNFIDLFCGLMRWRKYVLGYRLSCVVSTNYNMLSEPI